MRRGENIQDERRYTKMRENARMLEECDQTFLMVRKDARSCNTMRKNAKTLAASVEDARWFVSKCCGKIRAQIRIMEDARREKKREDVKRCKKKDK